MYIYADNAATTMPDKSVLDAVAEAMNAYGNPDSRHKFGEASSDIVEKSREIFAKMIKAHPEEIYFTSGATESNNIVVQGSKKIFASAVEHASVLKIKKQKRIVPVSSSGIIDVEKVRAAKRALVSVMLVNNEVGTIQPIKEVVDIAHEKKSMVHSDAAQGLLKVKINCRKLEVDSYSFSAHKCHGPKGTGAIFIREGIKINPLMYGGGQEKKLRPGTLNVPGIAGFAVAVKSWKSSDAEQIESIRKYAEKKLPYLVHGRNAKRAPHITSVHVPGCLGSELVRHLSLKGIACSTGSACSEKKQVPSHVLRAMKVPEKDANETIRLSWSKWTRRKYVDHIVSALESVAKNLRVISPYERQTKNFK